MENCYYRHCSNCKTIKASDIIADDIDPELQEPTSWSIWKKVGVRYELLHVNGPFMVLLEEIDNLWSTFITHSFYTRKQREYIGQIKELSSDITYAAIQMDFAQNFTFVTQREIQSAYYSRKQAALYTIYIKIGSAHRNMVIISDYLSHDTRFVYMAQKLIVEFLKKEYKNVFKINYVSDGATAHFKSEYISIINHILFSVLSDRFNICNLAYHYADFGMQASWTYNASGHGKGPCDGLGAVVKSAATHYLLKGGPHVSFATPKDFFEWSLQRNDRMVIGRPKRDGNSKVISSQITEPNRPIEIRWLCSDTINQEYENNLKHRWE